jgi:hypothetical protein
MIDFAKLDGFLSDSSPSRFPEDIEVLNRPEKDEKNQSSTIGRKSCTG